MNDAASAASLALSGRVRTRAITAYGKRLIAALAQLDRCDFLWDLHQHQDGSYTVELHYGEGFFEMAGGATLIE